MPLVGDSQPRRRLDDQLPIHHPRFRVGKGVQQLSSVCDDELLLHNYCQTSRDDKKIVLNGWKGLRLLL